MALLVERGVVHNDDLAFLSRRGAGGYTSFRQRLAQPVGVLATVCKQRGGGGNGVEQGARANVVGRLPRAFARDFGKNGAIRSSCASVNQIKSLIDPPPASQ